MPCLEQTTSPPAGTPAPSRHPAAGRSNPTVASCIRAHHVDQSVVAAERHRRLGPVSGASRLPSSKDAASGQVEDPDPRLPFAPTGAAGWPIYDSGKWAKSRAQSLLKQPDGKNPRVAITARQGAAMVRPEQRLLCPASRMLLGIRERERDLGPASSARLSTCELWCGGGCRSVGACRRRQGGRRRSRAGTRARYG
jgi:hypothetical protein